jgi:hypothetical protein
MALLGGSRRSNGAGLRTGKKRAAAWVSNFTHL